MQRFYAESVLLAQLAASDKPYLEFLRIPAMSVGLYVLPVGATDTQTPHAQDEIYYVLRGCARFTVTTPQGEQDRTISPGDIFLVRAHEEHHFHSIADNLTVLVVFAPAEVS